MIHPGVIAGSPKGVIVYVYGSGTPTIHGTYIETGTYGGYSLYLRLDGLRQLWRNGDVWTFTDSGDFSVGTTTVYFYDKAPPSLNPWDVTQWQKGDIGTTPSPTVSLTPPGTPVAMNISGAGSGGGQPIDIPLIGTLNGKPHYYLAGPIETYEFKWTDEYDGLQTTGFAWICEYSDRVIYKSEDNVDYPHECVWELGNNGILPLPTVTPVY